MLHLVMDRDTDQQTLDWRRYKLIFPEYLEYMIIWITVDWGRIRVGIGVCVWGRRVKVGQTSLKKAPALAEHASPTSLTRLYNSNILFKRAYRTIAMTFHRGNCSPSLREPLEYWISTLNPTSPRRLPDFDSRHHCSRIPLLCYNNISRSPQST